MERVVASKQLRLAVQVKGKKEQRCSKQTAPVGHGDGRRQKSKTEKDGSYLKMVNAGVVLSLTPILKSWQLCFIQT